MAQRSHVPKFGNWESEENVPYTVFFDKARKGRGGKIINPNDPQENPDMFPDEPSDAPAPVPGIKPEPEEEIGKRVVKTAHERRRSRENGDFRPYASSPAHHDNASRRAPPGESGQRHGGRETAYGEAHRKPARGSVGSENSFDKSPLHPQARISGRGTGVSSPSREGKNSYDSSHGNPGRSRLKPASWDDDSTDNSAAVPKFGGWDVNDPSSADGYTGIFNKVREERHGDPGQVPRTPERYPKATKENTSGSGKICCFPWGKK